MNPTDTPADRAAAFYEQYRRLAEPSRKDGDRAEAKAVWDRPAAPSAPADRTPTRVGGYF
ncbi:MAG: hypothetical protein U0871_23420 [Gemmataceae bacterium]